MTSRSVMTFCVLVLIGAGFYFAPDGVAVRVRGTAIDTLRPGLEAVHLAKEYLARSLSGKAATETSSTEAITNDESTSRLSESLEIEREKNRALQIRLAQLNERFSADQEISNAIAKSERLILPALTEVAVLGDTMGEQWRAGKLIDQGSKNGLREHELVLSTRKSQKSLIDFGEDANISIGDALLLGRCVIGKVEHVGRWTSTFHLVTDSQYAGRAQLIRETTDGLFVFEAQGILKGQGGPLCKLEGIPAESSVHLHDAVYTAERDGILPTPLYYGEVVEASLGPDDRQWMVLVKPAVLPSHLTTVQVLRTAINPERLVVK